jgi:hypothetical protein
MLTLLISLTFNFDPIPSPQFAGDSVFISIFATDYSSSLCSLSIVPDSCTLEICGEEDNKINLKEGKWDGWIRIPCITDSIRLCCLHLESEEFYLSNKFEIISKVTPNKLRQAAGDSIHIYPNPLTPTYNYTTIEYDLTNNAHVLIMVLDKFGNPVWESETDQSAGRAYTTWDGTDNDGNRVFSGVYIVCVKATNQTQTIALYTGKIAVIR